MKPMKPWIALALFLASWPCVPAQAYPRVAIGVGIGFPGPGYYRPYYGYPYGYYYRPVVPIVVAPPPVVVAPQPVTVVQPSYVPAPAPAAPPSSAAPLPPAPVPVAPEQLRKPPTPVDPAATWGTTPQPNPEINRCLQQLADANEKTRAEAMIELGRLRSQQAIQPLQSALVTDRSPVAREAAARALGLIAAPSSLPALQQAAQGDEDREVRSSARFAAEVIRSRSQQ